MNYSKSTIKGVSAVERSVPNINGLFLVALSGGSDSLALAAASVFASRKMKNKFTVGAVIVDHQLQEGSSVIAEKTALIAENLGLAPVLIKKINVDSTNGGVEAAARVARYEAIAEAVAETDAVGVLMGHTMNDNAEQVMLGLLRGSGSRSLSGIAAKRDVFIRPFINLNRADTVAICEDNGLDFWVDPHNSSFDYSRVRVRESILPNIAEHFGDTVVKNLAKSAEISREDADLIDFIVEEKYPLVVESFRNESIVNISELKKFPEGLQKRILRRALVETLGSYGSFSNVVSVFNLIVNWRGQKYIVVQNGFVKRKKNCLHISVSV